MAEEVIVVMILEGEGNKEMRGRRVKVFRFSSSRSETRAKFEVKDCGVTG